MTFVVRVQDLRKTFTRTRRAPGFAAALRSFVRPDRHEVAAVDGVTFDVEQGECVAFVGPNGAGKSTTIRMLTGILHPSSGKAHVLGFVPWAERQRLAQRVGCVFGQRTQLWADLPVAESFGLLERIYGLDAAAAARRRAELVDLFALQGLLGQPVRKLSLGERMRCEIVGSLLHAPELILLDEPTIGLDVVARARIRELLVHLAERERVTVFLTSHDTGDIEHVCQRAVLIDEGRLVLDTSVEALKRDHLREKRVEAVLEEAAATVALPGVEALPSESHRAVLRVDTTRQSVDRVIAELSRSARILDLTVSDPPLERVLARLYGGSP